jgi:hypothetical protein
MRRIPAVLSDRESQDRRRDGYVRTCPQQGDYALLDYTVPGLRWLRRAGWLFYICIGVFLACFPGSGDRTVWRFVSGTESYSRSSPRSEGIIISNKPKYIQINVPPIESRYLVFACHGRSCFQNRVKGYFSSSVSLNRRSSNWLSIWPIIWNLRECLVKLQIRDEFLHYGLGTPTIMDRQSNLYWFPSFKTNGGESHREKRFLALDERPCLDRSRYRQQPGENLNWTELREWTEYRSEETNTKFLRPAILICAVIAFLIGLGLSGNAHPPSSGHVLMPWVA